MLHATCRTCLQLHATWGTAHTSYFMTLIYSCMLHVYMHQPQLMKHVPEYTFNPLTNTLNIKNIHQILILLSWQKSVMVSQHQNLCIYSSKDPKKVPESTNKLGAQEALRPYLGAKEAKAHRVLSQISLPTESILYKEGERCRCPVRINSQWTTTRTSPIKRGGATPLNMTVLTPKSGWYGQALLLLRGWQDQVTTPVSSFLKYMELISDLTPNPAARWFHLKGLATTSRRLPLLLISISAATNWEWTNVCKQGHMTDS